MHAQTHTHMHTSIHTYTLTHTCNCFLNSLSQARTRMYTYTCPHALTGYMDTLTSMHPHALNQSHIHAHTRTRNCTCTDRHREMMWCQEDAEMGGGGGNSVYPMWHRFFVRVWHSQQTHHRLTILSFLFWCFLQYPHRAIKPQRLWTKSTPGNELLRVLDSCDTCLSQNHPTVKSSGLLWHLHFTKSSDCKEFWILGTPAFYKIIRL